MPKIAVRLLRAGNRLVVEPTTRRIAQLLIPELSFVEKVFLHGKELLRAKIAGLPRVFNRTWECYGRDAKGRIGTSFGFASCIQRKLEAHGYPVEIINSKADRRREAAGIYEPQWHRIEGYKLRPRQREALENIAKYPNGRISCPPGWGKTFLIMLLARLFPKAKIAIVAKGKDVVANRIYPELALNLPNVGQVGCGKRQLGRRVTLYSADSLHLAQGDADFVFVDEGHQAAADDYAYKLGVFEHARMWAFSATWDMRLDGKDKRCEGMFGPIRMTVTQREAEKYGMVVPVRVYWTTVNLDIDPCGSLEGVSKERAGIWANKQRNKLIARDARKYDPETQVLIIVKTVEHALRLKKLLPEFKLVYNENALQEETEARKGIEWFERRGLIPENFRPMTVKRRAKITKLFEDGRIKKAIATSVWNVGVSFNSLAVLIRGDAGGSPINDTQIPGRAVRVDPKTGKKFAIVHDYMDCFNVGCLRKSRGRSSSYERIGWRQRFPGRSKSRLRRIMEWVDE